MKLQTALAELRIEHFVRPNVWFIQLNDHECIYLRKAT